ncbi:unnamed protein product, partial [Didymodactylos carnosus]
MKPAIVQNLSSVINKEIVKNDVQDALNDPEIRQQIASLRSTVGENAVVDILCRAVMESIEKCLLSIEARIVIIEQNQVVMRNGMNKRE